MPMEDYPTFNEKGDEVYLLLKEKLRKQPALAEEDITVIANFLAAACQKSLELQEIINQLLKTGPHDTAEVADLLATAEIAAGVLAQWHEESAPTLVAVVDLLRSQRPPKVSAKHVGN